MRQLIHSADVASVHIHKSVDPEHTYRPPSTDDVASYKITESEWLTDKSDYADLLRSADVFIAPRLYEGIGMSVLDAMANGLCVVAPNRATMNEYLQDGVTGILYEPKAPKRLDLSDWHSIGARGTHQLSVIATKYSLDLHYLKLFLEHSPRATLTVTPTLIRTQAGSEDQQRSILLFFPHNPFLRQNGVHTRFLGVLEYFKNRGFAVDMMSHSNFVDEWDAERPDVKRLIRRVFLVDFAAARSSGQAFTSRSPLPDFAFASLKKQFESIVNSHDYRYVIIGYIHWARLVEGINGVAKVLLVEDCISHNLMQRHGGESEYNLESSLRDEANRIDLFDSAVFISSDELTLFSKRCGKARLFNVPHIIQVPPRALEDSATREHDLLFVGSDNPFNVAGIGWFLSHVWPLLSGRATLAIAGTVCNHIPADFDDASDRSVTLFGRVEDLGELYLKSRVAICPLLGGTGLKIKVVEALSYGLPVISLSAGLIGIAGNKDGCLEVGDAKSFAERILHVLSDSKMYRALSEAALRTTLSQFSKDVVYASMDAVFPLDRKMDRKMGKLTLGFNPNHVGNDDQ